MATEAERKCRACLIERGQMGSLQENYEIDGKIMTFADILMSCAAIEVQIGDSFPQFICQQCTTDAKNAIAFKQRCEKSENALRFNATIVKVETAEYECAQNSNKAEKLLQSKEEQNENLTNIFKLESVPPDSGQTKHNLEDLYSCDKCGKKFRTQAILNFHTKQHRKKCLQAKRSSRCNIKELYSSVLIEKSNDAELYKILNYTTERNGSGKLECISCNASFYHADDLKTHVSTHDILFCKVCNSEYKLLKSLRSHIRLHVRDSLKSVKLESTNYKCLSCGKAFVQRSRLTQHYKTHTTFPCDLCGKNCFSKSVFLKHRRIKHGSRNVSNESMKITPVETRTCDICNKVFKYKGSMMKHRKRHFVTKKVCKFCGAGFDDPYDLARHMEEKHENEKNIICSVCGRTFFKKCNLRIHMIVHTGEKPFMCETCGTSFALAGNLAVHMRIHAGVKPFVCKICGVKFTQHASLRSHLACHSDKRDYVCADCGAAFSRYGSLSRHMKRHTGLKEFECSMCDKRFTLNSERKRHMVVHTGERNYVCDVCGKAFNRNANLKVHKRIHSGDKPHSCAVCGKAFIQAHCLATHIKTHQQMARVKKLTE